MRMHSPFFHDFFDTQYKALVEVTKNKGRKLENIFKKELTMKDICISMLMKC
jgi:hypothetical protein